MKIFLLCLILLKWNSHRLRKSRFVASNTASSRSSAPVLTDQLNEAVVITHSRAPWGYISSAPMRLLDGPAMVTPDNSAGYFFGRQLENPCIKSIFQP
jgi:hypothetical protein